jgi:Protein of unknown function (DUF3828)
MLTRRHVLLGAACAVLARRVEAADQSARIFITSIYAAYKGNDAEGVRLDNERAIRRYFTPALAALMIKDQNEAVRRGEVGMLDGDPFIDGQDWRIDAFDIAVTDLAPGEARAIVKFNNQGAPRMVVLDLVKIDDEWRISEITWHRDGNKLTLSGLFAPQ